MHTFSDTPTSDPSPMKKKKQFGKILCTAIQKKTLWCFSQGPKNKKVFFLLTFIHGFHTRRKTDRMLRFLSAYKMTLFNHPIHSLTHPLLPPKIEKSFYFQMYWVVPINCMNFAYIFQKKKIIHA